MFKCMPLVYALGNTCEMQRSACMTDKNINMAYRGACSSDVTTTPKCAEFCFEMWSPVCGSDGKTYGMCLFNNRSVS